MLGLILPIIVMSPDIVKTLVKKAGFVIVKSNIIVEQSDGQPPTSTTGNLYYDRDILMLLKLAEI